MADDVQSSNSDVQDPLTLQLRELPEIDEALPATEWLEQASPDEVVAGRQAVSAALQLYDLCGPDGDATITHTSLERVLRANVGISNDEDIAKVMRLVGVRGGHGGSADRVDFLSYWQGIDRFFAEAGGNAFASTGSVAGSDLISGMRRFRDGALESACRQNGEGSISSALLLRLLSEIREVAADKAYWDEVQHAIPSEDGYGLSLLELAEAVCQWLREALQEADRKVSPGEQAASSSLASAALEPMIAVASVPPTPSVVSSVPQSPMAPRSPCLTFDEEVFGVRRSSGKSATFLVNSVMHSRSSSESADVGIRLSCPSRQAAQDRSPSPTVGRLQSSRATIHGAAGMSMSRFDSIAMSRMQSIAAGSSGGTSAELQLANELLEAIGRAVSTNNARVHQTLTKLSSVHDSIARALSRQEDEVAHLRRSNEMMIERRKESEGELLKVGELVHENAGLTNDRDHALRSAEALSHEVTELKEHLAEATKKGSRLQAQLAEVEREKMDTQRRDWQWRDKCEQFEKAALTAEGQSQWMRSEIEKHKRLLEEARKDLEHQAHLTTEVPRLRRQLGIARSSLRSFAGAAQESDECVEALRDQLQDAQEQPPQQSMGRRGEGPFAAHSNEPELVPRLSVRSQAADRGATDVDGMKKVVHSQQAELQQLRTVRDALLTCRESAGCARDEAESQVGQDGDDLPSPRLQQAHRRSIFFEQQVEALLSYCHQLERMIDASRMLQRGSSAGPGAHQPGGELNRSLSIQRLFEEGNSRFGAVFEELHTLQVQKADVDQEVRRLQLIVADQDGRLKEALCRRDELLAELNSVRKSPWAQDTLNLKIREGKIMNEFYIGDCTTSESRSSASGTPGHHASSAASTSASDVGSFLTRASTTFLQPSPKANVKVHRQGVGVGVSIGEPREMHRDSSAGPVKADSRRRDRDHTRDRDRDRDRDREHRHARHAYREDHSALPQQQRRHHGETEEDLPRFGYDDDKAHKTPKRSTASRHRPGGESDCGTQ